MQSCFRSLFLMACFMFLAHVARSQASPSSEDPRAADPRILAGTLRTAEERAKPSLSHGHAETLGTLAKTMKRSNNLSEIIDAMIRVFGMKDMNGNFVNDINNFLAGTYEATPNDRKTLKPVRELLILADEAAVQARRKDWSTYYATEYQTIFTRQDTFHIPSIKYSNLAAGIDMNYNRIFGNTRIFGQQQGYFLGLQVGLDGYGRQLPRANREISKLILKRTQLLRSLYLLIITLVQIEQDKSIKTSGIDIDVINKLKELLLQLNRGDNQNTLKLDEADKQKIFGQINQEINKTLALYTIEGDIVGDIAKYNKDYVNAILRPRQNLLFEYGELQGIGSLLSLGLSISRMLFQPDQAVRSGVKASLSLQYIDFHSRHPAISSGAVIRLQNSFIWQDHIPGNILQEDEDSVIGPQIKVWRQQAGVEFSWQSALYPFVVTALYRNRDPKTYWEGSLFASYTDFRHSAQTGDKWFFGVSIGRTFH